MSQPSKTPPTSSLSSISRPASVPSSPTIKAAVPAHTQPSSTPPHEPAQADAIKALQIQQQSISNDMSSMKDMLQAFMKSNSKVSSAALEQGNGGQGQGGGQAKGRQPDSVAAKSNTLSNRDKVKQEKFQTVKQLFNLSDSKLQAITRYIDNNDNDLNDSVIFTDDSLLDESKASLDSTVSKSHNLNFISKLLPASTATSQATIAELLQSGLKANATTHANKIKDVEEFIKLLTEQAKATVALKKETSSSDFLLYTMQLMQLLIKYGLKATLEYHFALMKKVQTDECELNSEQPMLLFDLLSKYRRLQHTNLLTSTLIHQSSGATAYDNKSKSGSARNSNTRTSTAPFTGTPCAFHTKLLGHAANHSAETCRAKGKTKGGD